MNSMKGILFYLGQGHNEVFAVESEPLSKDEPDLVGYIKCENEVINRGSFPKIHPQISRMTRISEVVAKRLAPALIKELNPHK